MVLEVCQHYKRKVWREKKGGSWKRGGLSSDRSVFWGCICRTFQGAQWHTVECLQWWLLLFVPGHRYCVFIPKFETPPLCSNFTTHCLGLLLSFFLFTHKSNADTPEEFYLHSAFCEAQSKSHPKGWPILLRNSAWLTSCSFKNSFSFRLCCTFQFFTLLFCPDITAMVDWV